MIAETVYQYPFLPQLMPVWHVMIFILGCCIGSFLNVCIWRIPRGESIVSPPSRCPKCGHTLPWYENIPLVSWLVLRGKCSSCQTPISSRYFWVELLTGILFLLLWWKITVLHQPLTLALVYFPVTALAITTTFIDIEHYKIPDLTTIPVMLTGVIAALLFPKNWSHSNFFPQVTPLAAHFYAGAFSLISLGVAYGIMAALAIAGRWIFKQDALGWGDVKYIAAIGACLGLKACFFTLLFASLLGAATGLVMIGLKRANGKTALPFGPFLALGTYIWMSSGEKLTELYLSLVNSMQ